MKGFTLIELLVVVLIIGILAAVALPQYTKAVMKTRTMSLLPMLRSINNAEQVYYLANGMYTISFDDLDISMPAGATITRKDNEEYFSYHNWECLLRYGTVNIAASYSAYCYSTLQGMPKIEKYLTQDDFVCWGGAEGSDSYSLCRALAQSAPTATKADGTHAFHFN